MWWLYSPIHPHVRSFKAISNHVFQELFSSIKKSWFPGSWSGKFCNLRIYEGSAKRKSHKYFWRNDKHVINMYRTFSAAGVTWRMRETGSEKSVLLSILETSLDTSPIILSSIRILNWRLIIWYLFRIRHQSPTYKPTSNLLKWMSLKLSSWLNSESCVIVVTVEVWPLCSVSGAMFSLMATCLVQMKTDISIESYW